MLKGYKAEATKTQMRLIREVFLEEGTLNKILKNKQWRGIFNERNSLHMRHEM